MDLGWTIGKWLCFGACGVVFGLLLIGFLGMVASMAFDAIRQRRRRAQFRKHEVFRTKPGGRLEVLDSALEERLKAIGAFTSDASMGRREIVWKSPHGLACDFAPLELIFTIDPDNVGPDDQTFGLWERYRSRHAALIEDLRARWIAMVRGAEPDTTAAKALAEIESFCIDVAQEGYGEAASHELRACFRWQGDDHAYNLLFDPESGTFGDWEE